MIIIITVVVRKHITLKIPLQLINENSKIYKTPSSRKVHPPIIVQPIYETKKVKPPIILQPIYQKRKKEHHSFLSQIYGDKASIEFFKKEKEKLILF